jgi:hypothetical protein
VGTCAGVVAVATALDLSIYMCWVPSRCFGLCRFLLVASGCTCRQHGLGGRDRWDPQTAAQVPTDSCTAWVSGCAYTHMRCGSHYSVRSPYLQPGFCLCISAVLTPCLGVSTPCMYMVLCLDVCCSRAGGSFAGFAASHVAHSQSMHVLTLALNLRQGMHVLTRGVPHADTWCHTVVTHADTWCHTC